MKPLAWLCTAALCISLCACSNPSSPTDTTSSTTSVPSTVSTTATKPAATTAPTQPQTPTKTIYVRTSYTKKSDTMDALTEYVYDENDLLTEVIQYSGTTLTKRYTVTCDDNGNYTQWDSESDTETLSARYFWDEEGRNLGNAQYLNDVLQYSTTYTWTDGLLVDTVSSMPEQSLETRLQYTYNSENLRVRSDYFVNNSLQRYGVYSIDDHGRTSSISYYLPDGTAYYTTSYLYGILSETQITQSAEGGVTQKIITTYDANGNVLTIQTYNGQNTLLSTETNTWKAITVPQDSPRASA